MHRGYRKYYADRLRCASGGIHSRADIYRGTAGELVAAGLVTVDMFPGQPGRPNTQTVFHAGALEITKSGKPFRVSVKVDESEHQRRVERDNGDRAMADASELADRALNDLPRSAQEYASRHLKAVQLFVNCLGGAVRPKGGYSFDDRAVEQFEDAMSDLRDAVEALKLGIVTFDPARREGYIARIRHRAAWSDAGFQGQLATIVAGAGGDVDCPNE